MSQSLVVQVGQCGNQIGCRFWDLALREHASVNKNALFDDAINSFFRNFDKKQNREIKVKGKTNKIVNLKARAVLVDMEEGVINNLLRGPLSGIFDCKQLLTSQSGSGNNWAVGHKYYGRKYEYELKEMIRKATENCDNLQTFFILHSMGGGTGSGVGTYLLQMLADDYPDVHKFCIPVYPSSDDDVITSPYNSILAMRQLTDFADCVLPIDNQALIDICHRITSAADRFKFKSRAGTNSIRSSITDNYYNKTTKPFDHMNNIVANLLLNLTSSSRFEGSMNVDLNEITTNLIPFPRLHYLMSSMAPLYGLMDLGIPIRTVDNTFSEAYSRQSQLLSCDPSKGIYLASALLLRGNICVSDIRRNIDKLNKRMKFVSWNPDGWKTGLCSVPSVGNSYSLLALSNNTSIYSVFNNLLQRFDLLFKRKAHLHHYLQVDGMEMSEFEESAVSVANLIAEYKEIGLNRNEKILPSLQVVM